MSEQQTQEFSPMKLLGPLLMSAILKGEDISPIIDALVDAQINQMILDRMLAEIQVPEEWKPIVDTLKLVGQFDTLRAAMAALRGEEYKPSITIDKIISLIFALQMIRAVEEWSRA